MKNCSAYFLVAVLFLLTVSSPVYAAFPISTKTTTVETAPATNKQITTRTATTHPVATAPVRSDGDHATRSDGPGWGIASLACGLAGLLFTPLGIPAIIFGIKGMKREKRGLAIAGLVLGIIEVFVTIAAIIILVLVFSV